MKNKFSLILFIFCIIITACNDEAFNGSIQGKVVDENGDILDAYSLTIKSDDKEHNYQVTKNNASYMVHDVNSEICCYCVLAQKEHYTSDSVELELTNKNLNLQLPDLVLKRLISKLTIIPADTIVYFANDTSNTFEISNPCYTDTILSYSIVPSKDWIQFESLSGTCHKDETKFINFKVNRSVLKKMDTVLTEKITVQGDHNQRKELTLLIYYNPVIADFNQTKDTVLVDEEVCFNNTSLNWHTLEWNIGGNISTKENPCFTFSTAGIYEIKLTGASVEGLTDTVTSQIVVTNGTFQYPANIYISATETSKEFILSKSDNGTIHYTLTTDDERINILKPIGVLTKGSQNIITIDIDRTRANSFQNSRIYVETGNGTSYIIEVNIETYPAISDFDAIIINAPGDSIPVDIVQKGDVVQLINNSRYSFDYEWKINGQIDHSLSPSIIIKDEKEYNIVLNVTSYDGKVISKGLNIPVGNKYFDRFIITQYRDDPNAADGNWDDDNALQKPKPDIFIMMYTGNTLLYKSETKLEPDLPVTYQITYDLLMSEMSYNFYVYDEDENSSSCIWLNKCEELMDQFSFKPGILTPVRISSNTLKYTLQNTVIDIEIIAVIKN